MTYLLYRVYAGFNKDIRCTFPSSSSDFGASPLVFPHRSKKKIFTPFTLSTPAQVPNRCCLIGRFWNPHMVYAQWESANQRNRVANDLYIQKFSACAVRSLAKPRASVFAAGQYLSQYTYYGLAYLLKALFYCELSPFKRYKTPAPYPCHDFSFSQYFGNNGICEVITVIVLNISLTAVDRQFRSW